MTELSYLDREQFFTAIEAAALIHGSDAHDPGSAPWKWKSTLKAIESAYSAALTEHKIRFHGAFDHEVDCPAIEPEMLQCTAMVIEGDIYLAWVQSPFVEDIECQQFSRQELARWIRAVGINSIYQFEQVSPINDKAHLPGPNTPKLSDAQKAEIVQRWNGSRGESIASLARAFSVSRRTIDDVVRPPERKRVSGYR